jgi:exopolysaccharide biosynthesis polyprenyl glycosylphosphotransferase
MLRRANVNEVLLAILLDSVLVLAALRFAALFRPVLTWLPFSQQIGDGALVPDSLYAAILLLWIGVYLSFGLYDPQRVYRYTEELRKVFVASSVASLASAGMLYLTYRDTSRWLFLLFAMAATLAPMLWRTLRQLLVSARNGSRGPTQGVLIVGTGPLASQVADAIETQRWTGLTLKGFASERPASDSPQTPMPVLGTVDEVRAIISGHQIEQVVVALSGSSHEDVRRIVAVLHELPVRVLLVPDYLALVLYRARAEDVAGIPMVDLRAPALTEYQRLGKRAFDVAISGAVLLIGLPLMAAIAVAIKLDSRGPVLFRQLRVGENGRAFRMYKFRSMVAGAEDRVRERVALDRDGKLIHKHRDDPRVTRVGRVLRRLSLDELPQLFNVLKGDMSLVGPRPEMPWLVEQYEGWQRQRFSVPQGITGWWQINGRCDRPMHLHTEDDLVYIRDYSLWRDMKILWRTVWTVLQGRGAY